jgi:hypothetical protein
MLQAKAGARYGPLQFSLTFEGIKKTVTMKEGVLEWI